METAFFSLLIIILISKMECYAGSGSTIILLLRSQQKRCFANVLSSYYYTITRIIQVDQSSNESNQGYGIITHIIASQSQHNHQK